ncbi:hypothetical protein [Ancylobacter terrae]|uniref:hypothetical protein n=1 Tax=Ancylobacter sp. sgz301288 TaxID=3342077 RepID=UPI00385ED672
MAELPTPLNDTVTVVVVGSFIPRSWSTRRLYAQSMITLAEKQEIEEKINSNSVNTPTALDVVFSDTLTQFPLSNTVIQIHPNRLNIHAATPPVLAAFDIAVIALREIAWSPVNAFGLNRSVRVKLESVKAWHDLGYTLSPPANWPSIYSDLPDDPLARRAGLRSLTMRHNRPSEDGYADITLQPIIDRNFPSTVEIAMNDHYEDAEGSQPLTADDVATLIQSRIADNQQLWDGVLSDVMRLVAESNSRFPRGDRS